LITLADGDDFISQKSIKTPMFEDIDKNDNYAEDLNIIACDMLSDG
jgi:hypothetical protein